MTSLQPAPLLNGIDQEPDAKYRKKYLSFWPTKELRGDYQIENSADYCCRSRGGDHHGVRLIDRRAPSRARCFGVVGPTRKNLTPRSHSPAWERLPLRTHPAGSDNAGRRQAGSINLGTNGAQSTSIFAPSFRAASRNFSPSKIPGGNFSGSIGVMTTRRTEVWSGCCSASGLPEASSLSR